MLAACVGVAIGGTYAHYTPLLTCQLSIFVAAEIKKDIEEGARKLQTQKRLIYEVAQHSSSRLFERNIPNINADNVNIQSSVGTKNDMEMVEVSKKWTHDLNVTTIKSDYAYFRHFGLVDICVADCTSYLEYWFIMND